MHLMTMTSNRHPGARKKLLVCTGTRVCMCDVCLSELFVRWEPNCKSDNDTHQALPHADDLRRSVNPSTARLVATCRSKFSSEIEGLVAGAAAAGSPPRASTGSKVLSVP